MKIIDLTEFYSERGGVRTHLDQKGRILRRLGHEHVIIAPGLKDEVSDLPPVDVEARGSARVHRVAGPTLPYDPNYHLLWRLDKVGRIVRREEPHVLQINSPYLAALALRGTSARSAGIKTFWWHADVIDTYAVERLRPILGEARSATVVRPLWGWMRSIAAGCDATFAASQHQVDKLREHDMPRVRLMPFGIDKDLFSPDARSDAWRAGVTVGPPGAPIFVAVGRLSVEKQWPVLLEAFIRFRSSREARLVIFGEGPERARLEQQVSGRDDVAFMGFERDPRKIATALASADAFVHGCPFETFGLSVAQAIACGLPIVVPDRGGAAELARPELAEVYASSDAEAFAAALDRLVRRDPGELRSAAIRGRASIFSATDQVEHTVEAYRELLRESRKTHGDRRNSFADPDVS
ncbi:MAG TPA: glycosyltransferase [Polyangiaceae bacterium]